MSEEKSELWLLDEELIDKQAVRIAELEAKLEQAEEQLREYGTANESLREQLKDNSNE